MYSPTFCLFCRRLSDKASYCKPLTEDAPHAVSVYGDKDVLDPRFIGVEGSGSSLQATI